MSTCWWGYRFPLGCTGGVWEINIGLTGSGLSRLSLGGSPAGARARGARSGLRPLRRGAGVDGRDTVCKRACVPCLGWPPRLTGVGGGITTGWPLVRLLSGGSLAGGRFSPALARPNKQALSVWCDCATKVYAGEATMTRGLMLCLT